MDCDDKEIKVFTRMSDIFIIPPNEVRQPVITPLLDELAVLTSDYETDVPPPPPLLRHSIWRYSTPVSRPPSRAVQPNNRSFSFDNRLETIPEMQGTLRS